MAEPVLSNPTSSGLREATERIRSVFDAWLIEWVEADTIIHPGRVTQAFLRDQAGKAPRVIVAVQKAEVQTLAFGKQVNLNTTFLVVLIMPGVIEDRVFDALNVAGKAINFVIANPWMDNTDPTCPFAKSVEVGTAEIQTLYADQDELIGESMWLLKWDQLVDNGPAAETAEPLPDPLELITIDNRTEPLPDGETLVETQVD